MTTPPNQPDPMLERKKLHKAVISGLRHFASDHAGQIDSSAIGSIAKRITPKVREVYQARSQSPDLLPALKQAREAMKALGTGFIAESWKQVDGGEVIALRVFRRDFDNMHAAIRKIDEVLGV